MAVQGWTPINYIVAGTDDDGNDILGVVQLPLVPPKRRPPVCQCLGHDLLTHNHAAEWEEYERASSTSPPKPARSPTGAPKKSRAVPQAKYQDYPADTTEQEMINGDPSLLTGDNLYRIAQKYSMAELANAINASHNTTIVTSSMLVNRLQRAVDSKAKREGKTRGDVREELRQAQLANGVALNGRQRKSGGGEGEEQKGGKKRKADGKGGEKESTKKRKSGEVGDIREMFEKRIAAGEGLGDQVAKKQNNDAVRGVEEPARQQPPKGDSEVNSVTNKTADADPAKDVVWERKADTSGEVTNMVGNEAVDTGGQLGEVVTNRKPVGSSEALDSAKHKTDANGQDRKAAEKPKDEAEDKVDEIVKQNSAPQGTVEESSKKPTTDADSDTFETVKNAVKMPGKKRKSDTGAEENEVVKKQKTTAKPALESKQDDMTEKESNPEKENVVPKKQTKPFREVTASGFIMWNID
ncbi:hypothetical protein PRZ48_008462 [Zasmidium cellare]|uniref:Uncharacterized protein n=1 Tax=Zasmidium cellare TaxID=395010 RepID=A0ABR0EGS6_ZASCE|nr:hypothetical protein PRZ48_008462 [Zasmidium cellare]